jgi:hypothetical protein
MTIVLYSVRLMKEVRYEVKKRESFTSRLLINTRWDGLCQPCEDSNCSAGRADTNPGSSRTITTANTVLILGFGGGDKSRIGPAVQTLSNIIRSLI